MTKNLNNVRIFDGEDSAVYVAAKGTTGPTDLSAPASPFAEIGWISEDGVDETVTQSSQTFRAWQGGEIVRSKVTQADASFRFQALEYNLVTHGLKYRGQTPEVTGVGEAAVAKTTVTDQTAQDTRAWVFDMIDGDVTKRYVIPAGDYTMSGSIQHRSSGLTIYEFTVTPVGDYFEYTNDPAITGTSA